VVTTVPANATTLGRQQRPLNGCCNIDDIVQTLEEFSLLIKDKLCIIFVEASVVSYVMMYNFKNLSC